MKGKLNYLALLSITFLVKNLILIHDNHLRDQEICRLKQGHGNTMMQVEGKVKSSQEELSRRDNEIQELRVSLYTE